jgi:hypothetical protein
MFLPQFLAAALSRIAGSSTASAFGSTVFPVPAPLDGQSVSDLCLDKLGAYLQAVVNAKAAVAWTQVCPKGGATSLPIPAVHHHDPEETTFSAADLPALYLYREGSNKDPQRIADDYLITYDTIVAKWLFPLQIQERARIRGPFVNAITKILTAAIVYERDPAWFDPGDTEPQAKRNGSLLPRVARLWRIYPGAWRLRPVRAEGGPKPFLALEYRINVEERYEPPRGNALTQIPATLESHDTPPFVTNVIALKP